MTLKGSINSLVKKFGYEIIPADTLDLKRFPLGMPEKQKIMVRRLSEFSMTSYGTLGVLMDAVRYVIKNNIQGDVVECGIGKGGSIMAIAETLIDLESFEKEIFLYDTYEGFPEPGKFDINFKNETASMIKQREFEKGRKWGMVATLKEVKKNVFSTKYPEHKFKFIKGKVEDTIPKHIPEKISILRLDTDFYESTKHELIHLFPRLSKYGILIIDDYGHWSGSRKAVDEYFLERTPIFFQTTSKNGDILGVKTD